MLPAWFPVMKDDNSPRIHLWRRNRPAELFASAPNLILLDYPLSTRGSYQNATSAVALDYGRQNSFMIHHLYSSDLESVSRMRHTVFTI
jgi:hypothetical protein